MHDGRDIQSDCPFCLLEGKELVWSNDLVVAFRDAFPVSDGHTLVIPRRHVETYFEASPWEKQTLWQAVEEIKADLDKSHEPHGYNVGFNAGRAAGQTVMHMHLHVIPRYRGDMNDPRGGVRGVIPSKQNYTLEDNRDLVRPPANHSDNPFAGLESFVPGEESQFLPILRAAIDASDRIDILAAFVQPSGLEPIEDHLLGALERGGKVRVLTGDYMGITSADALNRLWTLSTRHPNLSVRLYQVEGNNSFHPKAYLFSKGRHGVAFVGSSNLSLTALTHGVEWNLKTTSTDRETFQAIRDRFETLFLSRQSTVIDAGLLERYRERVPVPPAPEPAVLKPTPLDVQKEVLRKLASTREAGHIRGLVVMATGLGKTFLSAFDFEQMGGRRALFVAHREEILEQAASTWAKVHPERTIGFLRGGRHDRDTDLVFASVQTLSRAKHLRQFPRDHFDYVVIDEFHHAAAASYRKLLAHFTPRFLLGLTATPDRMDGAALLELCDDNLVARVGLVEGITRGHLVPFHYFGVCDSLDYETIPWRSGRFDAEELTQRAATQGRAEQALREYRLHAPANNRRTLVFCCSKRHADFTAQYLSSHGVSAAAVHSGPTSAPRAASLERLRSGELEALVAVDIFNEGVDLPDINTILMLRPTESPVIFLQQLGRGLRKGKTIEKPALIVVDFIGNHRSFLVKPQALVALTGVDVPPGAALQRLRAGLENELPEGCSIDIETEALDLLESVAKLSNQDHLLYTYLQLRDSYGRRPSAREAFAAGTNLNPVRKRYGTWFDFVESMDDLTEEERTVLGTYRDWFADLMKTQMSRSFKMVCLEALADADTLHSEINVLDLAERCRARLRTDTVLRQDIVEHDEKGEDFAGFVKRWREMPLRIFHRAKGFSRRWYSLDKDRFVSHLSVADEHRGVFDDMTSELVALRLSEYSSRKRFADRIVTLHAPIELVVSHTNRNPILRFDRRRRPDIPEGPVDVQVGERQVSIRFVKIAANVATDRPGGPNVLPELMREWFGPTAGHPGTRHRVELMRTEAGGWRLQKRKALEEPGSVVPLSGIPYFPDLAVACGVASPQFEGHDHAEKLIVDASVKLDPKRHFVVNAQGDSMNGGALPIADGDLVLCEWATVTDPHQIAGQPVLLTGGASDEVLSSIKVPVHRDGRWHLRSTNPEHEDRPLDPAVTLRVVGRVVEVVQERTGFALWGLYDRDAIAQMFGHENNPSWRTGHRDVEYDGSPHSILMVNLRKPPGTPLEHHYADRFISPSELQWESQATTGVDGAKGRRILGHAAEGRQIHLFVRYNTKDSDGRGEPFTYCGTLQTLRHENEKPIRVWFGLDRPLPEKLWRAWSDLGQ